MSSSHRHCKRPERQQQWGARQLGYAVWHAEKVAVAWGVGKMLAFTAGAIETVQTIGGFIKTLKRLIVLKGKDTAAWAANTACVIANKVALAAHAVVGGMRWLVNGIATLMTNAVEWSVNTACIIANKAALIAHKAVGGVVWLVQQAAALGVASAAWIHNTAMMVVNKAGMVASAVASGVATRCDCRSDGRPVGTECCICSNANRLDRARPGSCCGRRCGAV